MLRTCHLRAAPALAVGMVAVLAAGALALTQPKPTPPTGSGRVHVAKLNLDGDSSLEWVYVSNLPIGTAPTTELTVWDKQRTSYHLVQRTRVWGPSPGGTTSGLRSAAVGDLNGDGRVEVAARESISPSAGEVMTILRQRAAHGLRFGFFQSIVGDVVQADPSRRGSPLTFTVTIKANHSRDGVVHAERWLWSASRHKWACASDCRGRP